MARRAIDGKVQFARRKAEHSFRCPVSGVCPTHHLSYHKQSMILTGVQHGLTSCVVLRRHCGLGHGVLFDSEPDGALGELVYVLLQVFFF